MFALLAACTGPTTAPPVTADPPVWTDPDGNTLSIDADGTLRFGDRTATLALGVVRDPAAIVNLDPWNLLQGLEPDGFHWRAAVSAAYSDGWTFTFEDGLTAAVTIDDTGPGVRITVVPDAPAPYVKVAFPVEGDEAFYGLGEWFDGAEHRGHVHPMHFLADPTLESSYNEAHVPVPFLTSTAGWAVLADSRWPGVFDVAAANPDEVTVTFNQEGGFSFDLYGVAPRDALARYHQRTGMPEVPPDWAFAPLQWRDEGTAADVLADAAAIRANGIPGGCVWIDNPWQTAYNTMVPDEARRYPDWDAMIDTLEAQGFRMLTWTTPYVEEADPEYDTYVANDWLVPLVIEFNQFGPMVDLTNPDAAAAWQGRVEAAQLRGIHGWKLDYGEDVQIGINEARLAVEFANGEDERTMHHDIVRYYHDTYDDEGDAFLLGRTGVLGGHVLTDAIWPGDLDSDFRIFGEDGHVGGLPAAVRGGTGLAASGYNFYASDTGGYRHERPTEEIFLRWTEYAALLPIFQYGGSGQDHNPWNYTPDGASQFTENTLEVFRRYAVLHTRLFPYFSMLAQRAATTGLPVVMAQGFAFPDGGVHPEDTFLVGDDLLVSVVETAGTTEKSLTLPEGTWVHWWTGEAYTGTVTVPAPLGEGPLFQRQGSAVPLLRPEVMTLASTDGSVESWADEPGRLNARVVPGAPGGFTLPSGEALAWGDEEATLTTGSVYGGWDIEVWAPGGLSGAEADGVALTEGADGCTGCWIPGDPWVRIVVDDVTRVAILR